jgi:peptidoglycan DL-endopeptidase CwlO
MLPVSEARATRSTSSAKPARRRPALAGAGKALSTAVAALAMVLGAGVVGVVGAPAAAAAPISNPSLEIEVKCPGAVAEIQVEWLGTRSARVHWSLEDTAADQKSPVLKYAARNAPGDGTSWIFQNGEPWFAVDGGRGDTASGGGTTWDPEGITQFNHLEVKVSNGTSDQDPTPCSETKRIYNYGMIAYQYALNQEGDEYQSENLEDGIGPDEWDCSGLLWFTYQNVPNFPSWTRMSSANQYTWAVEKAADNHTDLSNLTSQDVIKVDPSDRKVGDIVFYNGHVSFYAGDGRAFSALNEASGVGYNPVNWAPIRGDGSYYRIVGVR